MSWIIEKLKAFDTLYLVDADEFTTNRDNAKRFETKADAKAVQDKYNLGGSIIPA